MNLSKLIRYTLLICLLFGKPVYAQVTINASNQNWIPVNSANGAMIANAFQVQIAVSGANRNYPRWSLSAVVNQAIGNSEGKYIPANKIRIRCSNSTGPSFQQIGSGTTPIPLNSPGVQTPIITSSNYALQNGNDEFYKNFVITLDIIVEGGDYLEQLKSWQNYNLNLTFYLTDSGGNELSQSGCGNSIQIDPTVIYAAPVTYAIQIQDNMRAGLLELKTINDYVNGASVTYTDALKITSATPYSIQVRTAGPNFISGNNLLQVSVVNIELSGTGNAKSGSVRLSDVSQRILSAGANSNPATVYKYNLKYFTTAGDNRLINAKPENYNGIIIYELIPM